MVDGLWAMFNGFHLFYTIVVVLVFRMFKFRSGIVYRNIHFRFGNDSYCHRYRILTNFGYRA